MTQLKVLKRLKEFRKLGIQKDIQLEVSRFIIITYAKYSASYWPQELELEILKGTNE